MGARLGRTRLQLLLLLAAAAVLVAPPAAAKHNHNRALAPAPDGAGGLLSGFADASPPPRNRNNRRRPPPPADGPTQSPAPSRGASRRPPANRASPPAAPLEPSPPSVLAPTLAPAPSPATVAPTPSPAAPSPAPAPAPPVVAPENTMKLILKIAGAVYPLSSDQLQGVMWAINNYTAPVEFVERWQQASAPGTLPAVQDSVTVYPPPPPAEQTRSADGGGTQHHKKRRPPPPPEGSRRLRRLLAGAPGRALRQAVTPWWPTDEIPKPLSADGVYVFADAQATPVQQPAVQQNLAQATTTGQLCDSIAQNGVTCTAAAVAAEGVGTGPLTVYAGAATEASGSTTTSSGGLSTAALVGICVGAAVGVAIIAMVIYIIVGWRRERRITRAASLRTKSRRAERDVPPDEESRWRQMYSARMAESMRRAEEATARQQQQSRGPSFVEAQEREFAAQAEADQRQLTPQPSSKRSFGRGTPQTPALELSPSARWERDSPDHGLMTGSELSSPQPSVAGSAGKKKGLKKLFSTAGK